MNTTKSSKQAMDMKNYQQEAELTELPERWAIRRTPENYERVNEWYNNFFHEDYHISAKVGYAFVLPGRDKPFSDGIIIGKPTILTTAQFDRLVYQPFKEAQEKQKGEGKTGRPEIVCYCGSLRVALDAFKKAEYEAVINGEIALLPCCMFVDIQREYGAESDYKVKADDLHKRKIDICDRVVVLNVGGYIGESTRSEINYALEIGKRVSYIEDPGL